MDTGTYLYRFLIISLFSFFVFLTSEAQTERGFEFRGYFENNQDQMRIYFTAEDTLLNGELQFEGFVKSQVLIGSLHDNQVKLEEFDEYGLKLGRLIKAEIKDSVLVGFQHYRGDRKNFELKMIDLSNPPQFSSIDSTEKKEQFKAFIKKFRNVWLPDTLNYKLNVSQLVDEIGFLNKPVQRIGSYNAPFRLSERLRVIKNITNGGKIEFDGGMYGLIVQVYCDVWVDGSLFGTYLYIYNSDGNFVDAFVLFEGKHFQFPEVYTLCSRSKIFTIHDQNMIYEFSVEEDGTFRFRNRY